MGIRSAVLALLVPFVSPAFAQSLQVAPVLVEFPPGQLATTITVTNRATHPTVLQVRPFAWSQEGARDMLAPTDLLAASPPIAELPPGSAQTVRLVLRRPVAAETAFRILVDELPPLAGQAPPPSGVRVALRLSVPIFAEPAAGPAAPPRLAWRVLGGPAPALVATNTGGRRVRVVDPVLWGSRLAGGATVRANQNGWVLAGVERVWRLDGAAPLGPALRLTATTETGALNVAVPVVPAP